MTKRLLSLAALPLLLAACDNAPDPVLPDGHTTDSPPDTPHLDMPDTPPPDDAGPTPHVLRETISIDLRTVASLAVISETGTKDLGDPGLYALTESGEIVPVSFIEGSDGSTSSYPEPPIHRVYPTPEWILFSTWDWHAPMLDGDGGSTSVPCATLAAHRDTGALFCADLGIPDCTAGWSNSDPRSTCVHPNAAGDVVYLNSTDGLGRNVVFRLDLDPDTGPTGSLVPDVVGLNWAVVNAAGDLLVNFKPSAYDPDVLTRILPVDGAPPFDVESTGLLAGVGFWSFAVAGTPATPDENTFYVLDGAHIEGTDQRVLHVVARGDTGFTATVHPLTLEGPTLIHPGHCGFPHHLTGGIHLLCGFTLALVVDDTGAVIDTPTLVPLADVESTVDVGGLPMRFAPGRLALFASDGTNRKFVRHDGVTQQDILVAPAYELLGFGISLAGDIDFLANDTAAAARVRGTIPPDSTEVTILSAEEIDLAETVTFTRIN